MYHNTVWCYIIVLTLLDLSLNTKLSAQGKSHGNGKIDFGNGGSVHESLMDGISLQEWGEGGGRGRAAPAGSLVLSPGALEFGAVPLGAPHSLTVTLASAHNHTVHLASVSGTTPHFYASFFESKKLEPMGNTTFTVVYLGRHEGPVWATVFVHTSLGSVRYRVSATGVASEWRVWPLVGVRVPANATVEARLDLYNPGPRPVRVTGVAASGAGVTLALPGGEAHAPAAAWLVGARASAPLVVVRVRAPTSAPAPAAYLRLSGNMTDGPLLLAVEAHPAPPGEHLRPLHLRLGLRGSADPPDTYSVEAASSAPTSRRLRAAVAGAHCSPYSAPSLHTPPPYEDDDYAAQNGGGEESGVRVSLVRDHLDPHQEFKETAIVTLDYGTMWAQAWAAAGGVSNGGSGGAAGGVWCGGWVRVGRAALPYSVRLLRGTMRLRPAALHFVTSEGAPGLEPQEVFAHNEFDTPIQITHIDVLPEIEEHFHISDWSPVSVCAGCSARVAGVRVRAGVVVGAGARGELRLHTNVSEYAVPVLLYSAQLALHWEWPLWSEGALRLGAVGAAPVEVAGRAVNAGPTPLCAALGVEAPLAAEASLRFADCDLPATVEAVEALAARTEQELALDCRCVPAGGARDLRLRVAAGAWRGIGALWARARRTTTRTDLTAHPLPGDVAAPDLLLPPAAPHVPCSAPLVVENSMAVRMRVVEVTSAGDAPLTFRASEEGVEIGPGRTVIGTVEVDGERQCGNACYTGLGPDTEEGAAWEQRDRPGLGADAALAAARRAQVGVQAQSGVLHVRTDLVMRIPVRAVVRWHWPSLLAAPPPPARRVPLGTDQQLVLHLHNPTRHPLLLQPVLDPAFHHTGQASEGCERCVWSEGAFAVGGWRVTRGQGAPASHAPRYLLLQPRAYLDLTITFRPDQPADLAVYLYLRNNLTVVERVLLTGRGAHPSFELGGRKPNSTSPITLEVAECGGGGGAGMARRTLSVRNTGAVPLRLRDWRVAGAPCAARGFTLHPCAPLSLAPNDSRTLTLTYAADWTATRAAAALTVRAGARTAHWQLAGAAPARLVRRCAPHARRPPFEAPLRALGAALALLALAGAAALAAVDAERALRRARASRPPLERGGAPLDLRALARPSPPPAVAAPRRRRTPRRRAAPLDPAAERRAFEVWRAGVERRAAPPPDDDSPSEGEEAPPPPSPSPGDTSSSSPDSSPPPTDSYSASCRRESEADEEGASTGSDSSSSVTEERSEPPGHSAPPAAHPDPPRDHPPDNRPPTPAAPTRGGRTSRDAGRGARSAGRRERAARRRERAPSPVGRSAPRVSPRPPPAVRWGASWSSVVSRGPPAPPPPPAPADVPPLAPIGSDVRRRLGSHSLFYYGSTGANGPGPQSTWPPASEAPPPLTEWGSVEEARPAESVWGGADPAAWLWGGGGTGAVRPPPGFPPPRPVRPYDPFHSLASIWTPAALDWRLDSSTPPLAEDKHESAAPQ